MLEAFKENLMDKSSNISNKKTSSASKYLELPNWMDCQKNKLNDHILREECYKKQFYGKSSELKLSLGY